MSDDPRQIWDWTPDDERKNRRDSITAMVVPAVATVLVLAWLFAGATP